jgi:hypothetical protein
MQEAGVIAERVVEVGREVECKLASWSAHGMFESFAHRAIRRHPTGGAGGRFDAVRER